MSLLLLPGCLVREEEERSKSIKSGTLVDVWGAEAAAAADTVVLLVVLFVHVFVYL